jgi:hypothetical protein
VAETWRIPPEVVEEYKMIENFKASRHNMWIQAKRDLEKEWLQMRYCVTTKEVQWEMKDWTRRMEGSSRTTKGQATNKGQTTKEKQPAEVGSSQRKGTPVENTRDNTEQDMKPIGGVQQKRRRLFPSLVTQQKDCTETANGATQRKDEHPCVGGTSRRGYTRYPVTTEPT